MAVLRYGCPASAAGDYGGNSCAYYVADTAAELPGAALEGERGYAKDTDEMYVKRSAGWGLVAAAAAGVPAGCILLWAGLLANIPAGWNLCDGTNGTPDLRDKFVKGAGAAEEPGGTGGAATHTHAAGTLANDAVSAGTPAGTNSAPTFTGSALGTHSHGVGTLAAANESAHTHSVTSNVSVDDHASHTHTYTQVPNHVHVQNAASSASGGLVGSTPDASTNTSVASGYSTANPTGGVATGTTNGPGAALTHTANNPAVTSGAGAAHTHTLSGSTEAVGAGTPAGTVSAPTFTGNALGTHLHTISGSTASGSSEPAYYKIAYIQKAA